MDVDPRQWTNRQRLQFLMDSWGDIFGPNIASSLSEQRGGSGLSSELPAMSHAPSVRELQRCLEELRKEDPVAYRHLKAFRCRAEWRQVRAKVRVQLQSGRWDTIPGWKRERIVPAWINFAKAVRGERFVADIFRGDVFIPKDLWDGLTKA